LGIVNLCGACFLCCGVPSLCSLCTGCCGIPALVGGASCLSISVGCSQWTLTSLVPSIRNPTQNISHLLQNNL
jgi:hypothetical protein